MILTVTVLLVWFGLALLTVGALNVWKLVVMRPSETLVEHRLLTSSQQQGHPSTSDRSPVSR